MDTMQRKRQKAHGRGRTQLPCKSCGEPVQLQSRSALIEPVGDTKRSVSSEQVWHRECFNNYLDQGEET